MSDMGQTVSRRNTYDPCQDVMRTHYLHLAAFTCEACNGPVIAGSLATRESEIQRETDIREVGPVCLSCRKQYSALPTSRPVRHLAPVEWEPPQSTAKPAVSRKKEISIAEPVSVVRHYIQ